MKLNKDFRFMATVSFIFPSLALAVVNFVFSLMFVKKPLKSNMKGQWPQKLTEMIPLMVLSVYLRDHIVFFFRTIKETICSEDDFERMRSA